jgi:methenyltetrahydromethanopterin cyclohydrolase
VTDKMPDHPDETRLREGERALAVTVVDCARQAADALDSGDRFRAMVELGRLATVAAYGARAERAALADVGVDVDPRRRKASTLDVLDERRRRRRRDR